MKFHHQDFLTFIKIIFTRKFTCFVISLIFLPLFLNLNLAHAEQIKLNEVESEIIYHTYNTNYERAENLIQLQINGNPDSLKYIFFYLAYNYLKTNFVLQEFRSELREEKMDSANSQIINYAENQINQIDNPDKLDTENKLFLGAIYGYLAQLNGDQGSYWDAFVYGKAGINYLEEALAEDSTVYDAYFGLGLFEYFVDRYSGVTQFILNILGFEGNRERGLKYIQIAIEGGKYAVDAAKLALISLYIGYEDNEELAIPHF